MKLKYVITGTGRCGTLNAAHNFTRAGVPCGHESIFDYKGIDAAKKRLSGETKICASEISLKNGYWFDPILIQADSSYMSTPFLGNELLEDVSIVHLIRSPLEVISSFVKNLGYFETLNSPWEKFICLHAPSILNFETPIERACEYYFQWNSMIAKHKTTLHKIEEDINILFEKLGINRIDQASEEKNIFGNRNDNFKVEDIPTPLKHKIESFLSEFNYEN